MTLRQQQSDRVRQVARWFEGWAELRPTVEALQAAAAALEASHPEDFDAYFLRRMAATDPIDQITASGGE